MKKATFQNNLILPFLNAFGYSLMIAVNYLANALPVNNLTTGELAAMYPNPFTPAGITFSIWGIIYLALAAFIVYQFVAGKSESKGAAGFLAIGSTCALPSGNMHLAYRCIIYMVQFNITTSRLSTVTL